MIAGFLGELALVAVILIFIPIVINKSTEGGRFDQILPHLRIVNAAARLCI